MVDQSENITVVQPTDRAQRSYGGGYTREYCSILLVGGNEVEEREIFQGRADQSITLGSREVGTSKSRIDHVEALIDRIVDDLNYHLSDVPNIAKQEEPVQGFDDLFKEMCDVHLENELDFDFE